jgi:hypothetical protein
MAGRKNAKERGFYMSIELWLYLIDVFDSLSCFAIVSSIVFVIAAFFFAVNGNSPFSTPQEKEWADRWPFRLFASAIIFLFIACLIPSKATMEKIFAIRIAKSEVVTEAAGKVIKLIGKYLPGEAND